MFNIDFYPTPEHVIETMLSSCNIEGKVVLEPSAGSGNLVRAIQQAGAKEVLACENDPRLLKIVESLCRVVAHDFLTLKSETISHVDFIIMNPPFSSAADHINHAFNIAPPSCKIVALCNSETIKNPYSKSREVLKTTIETYGQYQELGECFSTAERKTYVNVTLIRLEKPGNNYSQEFEGFFMEEDEPETQSNGLMSYNAVRDLVNRYVECVKIYDDQLNTAIRLSEMRANYFDRDYEDDDRRNEKSTISISISRNGIPLARNQFKKQMQKAGWRWIFEQMDLTKTATKGLREDINKFVERQENVPFTMRNIYHMLDMVVQTTSQRMDKAIVEVFEKVTRHSHDNHYRVEGWKTNSHYLLTKRFIVPGYYKEEMEDMVKALCYITGENYDDMMTLERRTCGRYFLMNEGKNVGNSYGYHQYEIEYAWKFEETKKIYPSAELVQMTFEYGQWFEWGFFRVRKYKKGTIHFEFKDEDVWAKFNQRVAKIKGFPLPEKREQTEYQKRQAYAKESKPMYKRDNKVKPTVIATFSV